MCNMSIRSAVEFGARNGTSRYGEPLIASDGNGELYGDDQVRREVDETGKLTHAEELMLLEAEIARSPQPGDKELLDLIQFDRIMLENQMVTDGDYEFILDTYPDLPKYIRKVVHKAPEVVSDLLSDEKAREQFIEAPVATLKEMADDEASKILGRLVATGAQLQVEQLYAERAKEKLAA